MADQQFEEQLRIVVKVVDETKATLQRIQADVEALKVKASTVGPVLAASANTGTKALSGLATSALSVKSAIGLMIPLSAAALVGKFVANLFGFRNVMASINEGLMKAADATRGFFQEMVTGISSDALARLEQLENRITTLRDKINETRIEIGGGAQGAVDVGGLLVGLPTEKQITALEMVAAAQAELNRSAAEIAKRAPMLRLTEDGFKEDETSAIYKERIALQERQKQIIPQLVSELTAYREAIREQQAYVESLTDAEKERNKVAEKRFEKIREEALLRLQLEPIAFATMRTMAAAFSVEDSNQKKSIADGYRIIDMEKERLEIVKQFLPAMLALGQASIPGSPNGITSFDVPWNENGPSPMKTFLDDFNDFEVIGERTGVGLFDSLSSSMARFVDGTLKGSDAIKAFGQSFLQSMAMIASQALAAKFLGSLGFDWLFPAKSAKGNVFSGGEMMAFAGGGVVGGPTIFPMRGGRTGLMGEAGPEAIMPLGRDSSGRLGVRSGGGVNVALTLNVGSLDPRNAAAVILEKSTLAQIEDALANSIARGHHRGLRSAIAEVR